MVYLIFAVLLFAADRVTKLWIMNNAMLGERIWGIDGLLGFVYVRNEGAAFSILSGKLGILSVVSVAFCIGVIIYWIKKKPTNKLLCTALMLMASGAAGNAFDRIMYGYVVDFIGTEFIDFPVFNIADIGITVGAVLLVLYAFLAENGEKGDKNDSETDGTVSGEA